MTARHKHTSIRALAALVIVWVDCAVLGVDVAPETPLASVSTAALAADELGAVQHTVRDRAVFASELAAGDPQSRVPTADLLARLRGKDVIFAVVESYGQVAVQGTSFAAGVDAVLRDGSSQLAAAGFQTRSAFLTSPTFGGVSWLAHSTLQSGLWIDSQQRYDQLMDSHRFTLSRAFARAGWRTVVDVPSNTEPWPDGSSFYGYDQVYGVSDVGYLGPPFSYARIPDQYTLDAFRRLELPPGHLPVMAEIDLVSSHTPWTPLPRMVPWQELGDGSVYDPMPDQGLSPTDVWRSTEHVQQMYGESIEYSLRSLISFVTTYGDDNLVLVIYGDHEPATIVSGSHASYQVPITIVARDPEVSRRIASWHWTDGMLPARAAPVWPMSAFRDRFFAAFNGPT